MIKIKFYFCLCILSLFIFSCTKDAPIVPVEPPRDYAAQYKVDIELIEDYLKTNYITIKDKPGEVEDQDVTITKIDKGQRSIMSYLNAKTYPQLVMRKVAQNNIIYNMYYLIVREGIGEYPCNTDGILTSYKGTFISRSTATAAIPSELVTTVFEEVKYPQSFMDLSGLDQASRGGDIIKGWKEVYPQFRAGTTTINTDGTVSYRNFGAGVMFLPSGLAYYNSLVGPIPAYSPLIFSIKFFQLQRLDHDNDGVLDFNEDINNDRYLPYFRELIKGMPVEDDTDKDGTPDYFDIDDDNDNTTTRREITKPAGTNSGLSAFFPFDPIIDNPLTPINEAETRGIPSYNLATKILDYTTPSRKRIHVDAAYPLK